MPHPIAKRIDAGFVGYAKSGLIDMGEFIYCAYKKSGVFHVKVCRGAWDHDGERYYYAAAPGPVYYPIFPGTTLEDVEGATHAYDDGTHWHFAHASTGEHYDTEFVLEAMVVSTFQPVVNQALKSVVMATDTTARTLASNYLTQLLKLVDDIKDDVEKQYRALLLGEHKKNSPHLDNHRAMVVASIRTAFTAWKEAVKNDPVAKFQTSALETATNSVIAELTETPTIEFRAAREARLAEEAKKKEESTSSGNSETSQG